MARKPAQFRVASDKVRVYPRRVGETHSMVDSGRWEAAVRLNGTGYNDTAATRRNGRPPTPLEGRTLSTGRGAGRRPK